MKNFLMQTIFKITAFGSVIIVLSAAPSLAGTNTDTTGSTAAGLATSTVLNGSSFLSNPNAPSVSKTVSTAPVLATSPVTTSFKLDCSFYPPTPSHIFYIDPVHGSANGDGSQSNPWNSLQAVFSGVNGGSPMLSTVAYHHRDAVTKQWVTAPNPQAPVKPGDGIYLMSGNYGAITIGVYGNPIINPEFVTIQAAPGEKPVLNGLEVDNGTTNMAFSGLTIEGLRSSLPTGTLAYFTTTSNMVFENNTLYSQADVSNWTKQDWQTNAAGGINVTPGTSCTRITGNHISNARGIGLEGDNALFDYNTLNNFTDDGLDYKANNLIISHNMITNNNDNGDGNHNDCMQGQTNNNGAAGQFHNILIDSNVCIRQTTSKVKFPTNLQGIDAFDSDWYNITVTNNIVITNAWDGISYSSVHGALIANNTVLYDGSWSVGNTVNGMYYPESLIANDNEAHNGTTWITVGSQTHEGSPSNDVIVRNNIADTLVVGLPASVVEVDHNLTTHQLALNINGTVEYYSSKSKPGSYGFGSYNYIDPNLHASFVEFSPAQWETGKSYDVMLTGTPGTDPAIGTGNRDLMPAVNFSGTERSASSPDLGACGVVGSYAYGCPRY